MKSHSEWLGKIGCSYGSCSCICPSLTDQRNGSEQSAITCPQFGQGVAAVVCYPDVRSIKGQPTRVCPDGEGSKHSSIAGPELGNAAAAGVRDPDYAGKVGSELSPKSSFFHACLNFGICGIPSAGESRVTSFECAPYRALNQSIKRKPC
jgi:hypothetical protein